MLSTCCFFLTLTLTFVQGQNSIDLTHIVSEEETIAWPTLTKFTHKEVYRGNVLDQAGNPKYYYEGNDFSQAEHTGTHLDAPAHFYRGNT